MISVQPHFCMTFLSKFALAMVSTECPNVEVSKTKSKQKKSKLQELAKEYRSSFTIHGLSKVFTGHGVERIVWAIVLLAGLTVTVSVVYTLVIKYQSKQVFTTTKTNIVNKIPFPAKSVFSILMEWLPIRY